LMQKSRRAVPALDQGRIWSAAEPARALGVRESTTRRYLDLLTDALMVHQLQPWHAPGARRST
ncbi:MAG: hypothetical protein EPN71_03585, partial [Rhodanobacter sp.]